MRLATKLLDEKWYVIQGILHSPANVVELLVNFRGVGHLRTLVELGKGSECQRSDGFASISVRRSLPAKSQMTVLFWGLLYVEQVPAAHGHRCLW